MNRQKGRWPGLVPATRRWLFGGGGAKVRGDYISDSNRAGSDIYGSMNKDYKVFRTDALVRRCLLSNAFFATMAGGFDTVVEATDKSLTPEQQETFQEKYAPLKSAVDEVNRAVDMDQVLFVAQVKRSIFGKAGFEILRRGRQPTELIPLNSPKITPKINPNWSLAGYTYDNIDQVKYQPDEVLYFTNIQLDADREGLSDIEPIRGICDARYEILHENFPEIVRTLWAPYVILQADTAGMTPSAEDAFLEDLLAAARSGKSIAFNKSVKATIVDMKADIVGLNQMLQDLKEEIIGNFGIPRLLIGQPIENRATAYAELDAYRDGIIAYQQRSLKRTVEAQWYEPLTRLFLEKTMEIKVPEDDPLPVVVKHHWRKVQARDMLEMSQVVANLWQSGLGPFPDNRVRLWEVMGFPEEEFDDGNQKPTQS